MQRLSRRTYNRRDFRGCETLGIGLIVPSNLLKLFP